MSDAEAAALPSEMAGQLEASAAECDASWLQAWLARQRNTLGKSVGQLTVVFVCLPALVSLWASSHWALELITHFRAYSALALAIGWTLCLLFRQWRDTAVITPFLIWHIALLAPLYIAGPTTGELPLGASHGESLRGMTINVLSGNDQKDEVIAYIRETSPDFVFAMEIDDAWAAALKELYDKYPHREVRWQGGAFGMGFLSRVPVKSIDVEYVGSREIPSLFATLVDSDGREFTLVGTHPLPPVGERKSKRRDEQLAAVADRIATIDGRVMLMGDLNTTGWSPIFKQLLEYAHLHDSRAGFGIQGTWAPKGNVPLTLPIDHVLTSEEFHIIDRQVGPDIGSDHRPVVVDFLVLTKPTAAVDSR